MNEPNNTSSQPLVETGIEGLDVILRGGLIQNRLYVVEGDPGSGKTVGEPLREFEGVLSGAHVFVGAKFSEASRDDK